MKTKDLLWITPVSLLVGALLAFIQAGAWWIGWLGFSVLLVGGFSALIAVTRWATRTAKSQRSSGERGEELSRSVSLAWIVALAFILRFAGGVATYLILPVNGYDEEDDKAGFVFTDARRRDTQAWELASSDHPIIDAFRENYAYDQYGGLLAFSAFIYRYFSPDAHRPLMLVLLSGMIAALGIPFLWKAVERTFGEKTAWATAWIFALYPESVLLGGSAMREPYIMTFSAMAFWGFVTTLQRVERSWSTWLWLGIGLLGMILVSPTAALFSLVLFAGWTFFSRERAHISWRVVILFAAIFVAGLFFLSASLNRSGEFNSASPLHVINDWFKLAVKWDAYQLERESGWVQKLFEEMPSWMRLPFVMVYGILRPVLPATLVDPTTPIWKVIYILRGVGWYALLPMLVLSFIAGSISGFEKKRPLWMWISLLAWTWILLASLRGGGDDWDNPRYRALLFLWQALMAGYVWVWWRETRNAWLVRVLACEFVFLLVFTQWYASRYFKWGGQLPFAVMIGLIFGVWILIVGGGLWLDKRRA